MGWLRSRLLRLYPPEWRARYGEEFEALLEQQRASLGTVLDVLAGALACFLLMVAITLLNRPRRLVPPALRGQAGAVREWRHHNTR